MDNGIVALEGMEFFAYHGFYKEEQQIGNKYSVDLKIETDFSKAANEDDLTGTIDYEALYNLVKHEMLHPNKLLESIGQKIIKAVLDEFPRVKVVEVSVAKFNPPIGGVCGKARVTLKSER
ncbi:MAG: dihydroneopterin aldolase [Roseivirga sp.]|nr:dihydroneopterin aldolase [Roseivirga sp.]